MRYFILILFFIESAAIGQEVIYRKTLDWQEPIPISSASTTPGLEDQRVLNFMDATYEDPSSNLPFVYHIQPFNGNLSNIDLSLSKLVYEEVPKDQLKYIEGYEISNEIFINYKTGKQKNNQYLQVWFLPIRFNPLSGKTERIKSFELRIEAGYGEKMLSERRKGSAYATNSVLTSGTWYKIGIEKQGIYRLTYDQLSSLGISNPSAVRLFGNGGNMLALYNDQPKQDDLVENAIWMEKGSDGIFNSGDYILFYAIGNQRLEYTPGMGMYRHIPHLFSDKTYYYLTTDAGSGKKIQDLPQSTNPETNLATRFDDFYLHEEDLENLIKSGRKWYEPFVTYLPKEISFDIPNIDLNSPVKVLVHGAARNSSPSTMAVEANGNNLFSLAYGSVNLISYISDYAKEASDTGSFLPVSEDVSITVNYNNQGVPSAKCWLDYVALQARRMLIMDGNQMPFSDLITASPGNVSRFILENAGTNIIVWEISDPYNVSRIITNQVGNNQEFKLDTDTLRRFIAHTGIGYLSPELPGGPLPNQNLHGFGPVDLIIVTHPDFLSQADQLAQHRKDKDGLRTLVATTESVYNEFSSGTPDISAIRNMVKMFYDRAAVQDDLPKYLLLFGDGSFDNKNDNTNNTNFIPTFQSENSIGPTRSYVTDDFYGLLDDDEGEAEGLVDIGIGRLPVKQVSEAANIVSKIIQYDATASFGDWKNSICFIGDDEDYNIHMRDANILATMVDTAFPSFTIHKIFLDAYPQVATPNGERYPEVNAAIERQVNRGALIVNYVGHGGENGLAHESILNKADINSWRNNNKFPLFITATCEFSRFDDIERSISGEVSSKTSAGELVLLNPNGGGIGLLTTTRLVYSSPNFILNRNFYSYVFKRDANQNFHRIGDVLRLTKNASGAGINKRNFTLLGDPSMTLGFPKLEVITTRLNGTDISGGIDTLKALSKITIEGYVANDLGNKLENFNGTIFPAIFDKYRNIETFDNDGYGPMQFKIQNNVLYKGKASVVNGDFAYTFIVPKDIAYDIDYGKISYYASYNDLDGRGSNKNILIGGFSDVSLSDGTGPTIDLYMNDNSFISGGITDENPIILAYLTDSSGINTVGNGIGHDLTAQLDDNTREILVLNDYYESALDSYQSGKIEYPLSSVESGEHRLKLKVWDVHNNSTEQEIDFIVAESAELALDHVFNYPNPFTTRTAFYFDHNQANIQLDVLIQIFTVSGKLIKTIDRVVLTNGYRSQPIEWDGLDSTLR